MMNGGYLHSWISNNMDFGTLKLEIVISTKYIHFSILLTLLLRFYHKTFDMVFGFFFYMDEL